MASLIADSVISLNTIRFVFSSGILAAFKICQATRRRRIAHSFRDSCHPFTKRLETQATQGPHLVEQGRQGRGLDAHSGRCGGNPHRTQPGGWRPTRNRRSVAGTHHYFCCRHHEHRQAFASRIGPRRLGG